MKPDEVKMHINNFVCKTVDAYIPQNNVVEKLKNGTIKLWISQHINKLDPIIMAFADENGDIDVDYISKYYEDILFENGEFRVDVRALIPDSHEVVKNLLPNKIILFRESDLEKIFA